MLQTGDFDKKTFEQITKQEPVVGYGGFLKGVKAENQYGVSYRELAKKSIQSWSKAPIILLSMCFTYHIRGKSYPIINKNPSIPYPSNQIPSNHAESSLHLESPLILPIWDV